MRNNSEHIINNKGEGKIEQSILNSLKILVCGMVFGILIGCKGEQKVPEEEVYVIKIEEKCPIEAEIEDQLNNLGVIGYIVGGRTDLGIFLKEKYGEKKIIKITGNRFALSNGQIIESVAYFHMGKPYKISELKKSKIVRFIK